MNDVEKMFLGGYRSIHTVKMIFGLYQWNSSPWGKEAHLLHHITSPTIYDKHAQIKICKNINMKTDITLSSCRCVEKQSRNVHVTCITIADKWTMLKKSVLGAYSITCIAKNICGAFQWNVFLLEFICHAISLHPWPMLGISVVCKFIINNIS